MKKVQKFAAVSAKITNVLLWIISIFGVVLSLGIFILLVGRSSLLAPLNLSVGSLEFTLDPSSRIFMPKSFFMLAALFVYGLFGVTIYILMQLKKIFRSVESGNPFNHQVSPAIRRIAFAQLLYGFLCQIIGAVVVHLYYNIYSMDTIFCNNIIRSCTLDFSFSFDFIFVFFILLLLSYVFQYGEELQTLSDETL